MFANKKFITFVSIVALVAFVLVMIAAGICIISGVVVTSGNEDALTSVMDYASPDDPGAGWLVIGGMFSSLAGGFIGVMVIVIGIMIAIGDVIVAIPALVAWLVWKKKQNVKWYWIWMGVWLLFCSLAVILPMVL